MSTIDEVMVGEGVPASEPVVVVDGSDAPVRSRKRSGRPAVGGQGTDEWDRLLKCFLQDEHSKTKNGLPGVPYALRNCVTALKTVWDKYVPGVNTALAPSEWTWIAVEAKTISDMIMSDVHCTNAFALLDALASAADFLMKRVSDEFVKHSEADVTKFTASVGDLYRASAATCVSKALYPSHGCKKNAVSYLDLIRIRDYIRDLRKDATEEPNLLRLLGWGNLVFTMLLQDGDCARGMLAATDADYLNKLVMDRSGDGEKKSGPPRVSPAFRMDVPGVGVFRFEDEETKAAITWAFQQREDANNGQRLLPRRLTVDIILQRLSTGVLNTALNGRVLSMRNVETVVCTELMAETMTALNAQMARCEGYKFEPLQILSRAVYPSELQGLAPVTIPEIRAVSASALVRAETATVETSPSV